jgi:hypothetical protein
VDGILVPMIVVCVVGGTISHIVANRRMNNLKRHIARMHVESMTALADASIEVLTVHYGVGLQEAMTKLKEEASRRLPGIRMIPEVTDEMMEHAQKMIDKKRVALKQGETK